MKIKDFIKELQKLDPDKDIWVMYDPPFSVGEPKVEHLVGGRTDYADIYDEVERGDYAIICGG